MPPWRRHYFDKQSNDKIVFSTLLSVKSITVFDCNIQKRIHVEQSPGRDFGRIHSEHHFFLTYGMCKAKLCCPQAKRIFVLCAVAVFFVTDNGIAHICELNSDLMSASSDEIDHHKTNVRLFCQNIIFPRIRREKTARRICKRQIRQNNPRPNSKRQIFCRKKYVTPKTIKR